MPNGQCPLYLKDAYSRETAVFVSAVEARSVCVGDIVVVVVPVAAPEREYALERFLSGEVRSIVEDATKPNMFPNLIVESCEDRTKGQ